MATNKTGDKRVVGQVKAGSSVRHIQIKLPVGPHEDAKRISEANGLSLAAYVRQALLKQIRADAEELKGGSK
jgi:hypothetical protein